MASTRARTASPQGRPGGPGGRPQGPSETYAARKRRGRPLASFSLPAELLEELRTFAEATGETQSSIVEKAVAAYLRRRR